MQCWGRAWGTDLNGWPAQGVRTWTELSWRCQGGADGMCRLCITRTTGSHRQARGTQMPRGRRVRAPCQPLACSHGAGRAVPPATADGGLQLRSVTPLADPVSSISRQVLKSPWKPAWQQPRQHPHSQRPAGAVLVAGGWWQARPPLLSPSLQGVSPIAGLKDAHEAHPQSQGRARSIRAPPSRRASQEAQSNSPRVLLLIGPAHKVIFSCTAPTFIHNSHGTGLTLHPAAGGALG